MIAGHPQQQPLGTFERHGLLLRSPKRYRANTVRSQLGWERGAGGWVLLLLELRVGV